MARKAAQTPPKNIVLVEGKDDLHVLWALLSQINFPEAFEVIVPGDADKPAQEATAGYERLRQSVRERIFLGNHRRIGVLVDADDNVAARWDSLRHLFLELGYSQTPTAPDTNGTIILPDQTEPDGTAEPPYKTIVGVYLMPDNVHSGALEHFLASLVPPFLTPLWDHAEACVAYLPLKPDPLTENWRAKARMHSYLAWQKEPGRPYGIAVTAQYLTSDAATLPPLLGWLRRLFEIGP